MYPPTTICCHARSTIGRRTQSRVHKFILELAIVLCALAPSVSAAEESQDLIVGLRSSAGTDELVRRTLLPDEGERLRALTEGKGIMRPDFKAAVLDNLDHADARVRAAALAAILPSRVSAGYPRLAASLASDFPGPLDKQMVCIPEGLTEFMYTSGPIVNQFRELGPAAGPTLVRFLSSQDSTTRRVAVHLIGEARWHPAVPHLIPLLHDPDVGVRFRAIKVLGVIGSAEARDALASVAEHADEETVSAVASYLSLNRDPRALPLWRGLVTQGKADSAGAEAAEGLRRHPFHDAVSILIEGLAARGVSPRATSGIYGWHEALKELTARDFGYRTGFESGPRTTAEEQAAAIARWNDWWRHQAGREAYEILADTMNGGPGCDAFGALRNLCSLGDPRAVPRLLPYWGRDPKPVYGMEHVTVEWALQTLSGRMLPDVAAWREWWESQHGRVSPAPFLRAPDPAIAKAIACIRTSSREPQICTDGRVLFVAGKDTFEVYDLANPSEPQMIGRYTYQPGNGWPIQVAAADGRMFLSDFGGVHIYRYTHQGDIEPLDFIPCGGGHVSVAGNRLLHLGSDHATLFDLARTGVRQLDQRRMEDMAPYVTGPDPQTMETTAVWNDDRISLQDSRMLPSFITGRGPGPATLSGRRTFALLDGRLYVLDVPTNRMLGEAPAGFEYGGAMLVLGEYCFAWLDRRGGVGVYDVTDSNAIRVLGVLPVGSSARHDDVRLSSFQDHLIVSDGSRIMLYRVKSSPPLDPR